MGAEKKVKKVVKKGGKKGKSAGGKKVKGKAGGKKDKKDVKRLNEFAKAFAYGATRDMIDLEIQCTKMNAATLEEVTGIFRQLKSKEKLNATAEGRDAATWAAGPDAFKDKDAKMLFNELKKGSKEKVDIKAFLDTCLKCVKIKNVSKVKTPKQIEEEKRAELYASMDWTDKEQLIATWPMHVQEKVRLMRAKKLTKDVYIDDFALKIPFGQDYLIDGAELKIGQRTKAALIGEGGSGKSSLFRAMAAGEIKQFPKHLQVHHMKEIEVSADAESLIDTVIHAHEYLMALRRNKVELEKRINGTDGHPAPDAETKEKLENNLHIVMTKLKENDNDRAEEMASKSLRVLGFDEVAQTKSINSLSGGLRMRVALCAAFFVEADILLLDEPTNHLDFPSLLWLEQKLRQYRKAFVMVCHDREILNNVVNSVMQITDELGIKYYDMDFEKYEKVRAKAEKKEANDVEKFLLRHRNIDFSSPLAVEAQRKRKWLENYTRKMVLRAGQFTFPPPIEIAPDNEQAGQEIEQADINVIKVSDVRFSYDPETLPFIFDTPINIDIKMSTRMGVMGPNGAGKSTFLKLLTGRLHPVDGTITTNKNATIGYFSQHHSAEMDLNMTPLEWMIDMFPEEKVGPLRSHLAKVGVTGSLTDVRMNDLSQGLRSCILFAKITYKCPSLLIMDEPTNFLDIETVDALISATNKYKGALLLVSHSRLFLKKCANSYLSIVPGQFLVFKGLSECEKSTYTFIESLEEGDKVNIGAGQLAQHGANKAYGGSSEVEKPETSVGEDGVLTI